MQEASGGEECKESLSDVIQQKKVREDLGETLSEGVRDVKEGGVSLLRMIKGLFQGLPVKFVTSSNLPDISEREVGLIVRVCMKLREV